MSDRDRSERPNLWRAAYALPELATPLVGRAHELAEFQNALDDGARLITITGTAGIGKTRLAVEVAHQAAAQRRFAAFLRLAPVRDAAMVPKLLASVCAIDGWPDLPIERFPPNLHGVLVLDGFDHVHDASASITGLLARCPNLLIIVTSRDAVQVDDERVISLRAVDSDSAIALLQSYGSGKAADLENLLAMAAGNPLALELIAGLLETGAGSSAENGFAGSLTLPELIGRTLDALTPEGRRLFERLCVSAAGFEASMVQALADCAPRIEGDVAVHISAMLRLGLVRTQSAETQAVRFEIPTAIREVGIAGLSASGEVPGIRLAYAAHMLLRATGVRDLLAGRRRNAALAWFEREYGGLRLAFGVFVQLNRVHQARAMAIALLPYWLLRRRFREARRWLTVALELTGAPYSDEIEQELLVALGLIELYCGNHAAARARSLAGARPGMPVAQTGWRGAALATLGLLAAEEDDAERAIGLYRVYLEASRSVRDEAAWTPQLRALTRLALSTSYLLRGELEEAEYQATMALKRGLALGDPLLVGYARINLAAVAAAKQNIDLALELYRDGILLLLEQPHASAASAGVLGLARLALTMKASALAARLIELARFLRDAGSPVPPYLVAVDLAALQESLDLEKGKRRGAEPISEPVTDLADAFSIVTQSIEDLADRQTPIVSLSLGKDQGGLTNREREVLCLASKDMSDLEIADALFISKRTSEDHMRNVIGKLGVKSRTGAVARALREGWCD